MIWSIKNWHKNQILEHEKIPDTLWSELIHMRCLKGLSKEELTRLREYATLFLHDKQICGAHALKVTSMMQVTIAIQACILILNLSLDYYEDWIEIIVYPGDFLLDYEFTDQYGIVHHIHDAAAGEAWLSGPVVLSWQEVQSSKHTGHNVVIHELAHKIDMLHEGANGCPPLHASMSARTWHRVFSTAYASFCQQIEQQQDTLIDPYAAENPAEFFAVLSEVFFESPLVIEHQFPTVYEQLSLFYRQDPATRWR